jgi:SPP1 family predicted phage head-tail adaptor
MRAPPLQAGKYRHSIVIKNAPANSSRDTYGRRIGSGTTVCTVWAEKQDWQGSETTQGMREIANVTTKWITRYRTDIDSGMQVVDGPDTYNIQSVLDFDGTHRELVLNCTRDINK